MGNTVCLRGDKGEAGTGAHFKCKAAAGSFVEFCEAEVRRVLPRRQAESDIKLAEVNHSRQRTAECNSDRLSHLCAC